MRWSNRRETECQARGAIMSTAMRVGVTGLIVDEKDVVVGLGHCNVP
jgi:hypothetical protein